MMIAVSGASGFIGRHVVAELTRRSARVLAMTREARRVSADPELVTIVEADIGDAGGASLERVAGADALVHLAWDGLPNYKSLHHFESELPKQYRFLRALVDRGLKNLIVTGTCFEYGMQSGPLSERHPSQPGNPYGLAKDCLRRQLEMLQGVRPFELTWARLFYTYGDGQATSSLRPQLRAAAARGDRTFDMSGGEQLRDYCPVDEVARLLVELTLRRTGAGVVNVCSGRPVSVRRLVEGWIAEAGWNMDLNLGKHPYPDFEPLAFWGERTKLDQLLARPIDARSGTQERLR